MTTTVLIDGMALADVTVLDGLRVNPPKPVIEWAEIPGGVDIDTSTLLTGGVPRYSRQQFMVPCLLTSGEPLWQARRRLSALLSGRRADVGFGEYLGWHVTGRLSLSDADWSWPGRGRAVLFTLSVDAEPYWYRDALTTAAWAASASPGTSFNLPQTGYPVMPSVTVTGSAVTLVQGTTQTSLPVGVTSWLDGLFIIPQIHGQVAAPVTGKLIGPTTAKATFTWREGWPG